MSFFLIPQPLHSFPTVFYHDHNRPDCTGGHCALDAFAARQVQIMITCLLP